MDNNLKKLEAFVLTEEAKTVFSGTAEEALEGLKAHGIELTIDELKAFIKGASEDSVDELNENDLADVAGGATYPGYERDCYNAGRKLCKALKWLFSFGKNFAS